MMAAPKRPFDIAREVCKPLTATERIALECLKQIASEGRAASHNEVCGAIGSDNWGGGTAPGVIRRLEEKGYIRRISFQRGLQVEIIATGRRTAPPRDTSPHWRNRTDRIPSPAIQAVRERGQSAAAMIEAEARTIGRPLSDFLADLVYIGWHQYRAEKEQGE